MTDFVWQRTLERLKSIPTPSPEELKRAREIKRQEIALCKPNCPHCGGIGYIRLEVPRADPRFGQLEQCPNMAQIALKRKLQEGDERIGLVPDELQNASWEDIRPGISDGIKAVAAVRPALAEGHGLIFLYGRSGQAKTAVLKIAVAETIRAGRPAAYANVSYVLDDIRGAFDNDDHQTTELLRRAKYWEGLPVLALDEMDKANMTEWARERFHRLIDARYTLAVREQALTIIASNDTGTGGLEEYIRSRLEDRRLGPCVKLSGSDGRKVIPNGIIR